MNKRHWDGEKIDQDTTFDIDFPRQICMWTKTNMHAPKTCLNVSLREADGQSCLMLGRGEIYTHTHETRNYVYVRMYVRKYTHMHDGVNGSSSVPDKAVSCPADEKCTHENKMYAYTHTCIDGVNDASPKRNKAALCPAEEETFTLKPDILYM